MLSFFPPAIKGFTLTRNRPVSPLSIPLLPRISSSFFSDPSTLPPPERIRGCLLLFFFFPDPSLHVLFPSLERPAPSSVRVSIKLSDPVSSTFQRLFPLPVFRFPPLFVKPPKKGPFSLVLFSFQRCESSTVSSGARPPPPPPSREPCPVLF